MVCLHAPNMHHMCGYMHRATDTRSAERRLTKLKTTTILIQYSCTSLSEQVCTHSLHSHKALLLYYAFAVHTHTNIYNHQQSDLIKLD